MFYLSPTFKNRFSKKKFPSSVIYLYCVFLCKTIAVQTCIPTRASVLSRTWRTQGSSRCACLPLKFRTLIKYLFK